MDKPSIQSDGKSKIYSSKFEQIDGGVYITKLLEKPPTSFNDDFVKVKPMFDTNISKNVISFKVVPKSTSLSINTADAPKARVVETSNIKKIKISGLSVANTTTTITKPNTIKLTKVSAGNIPKKLLVNPFSANANNLEDVTKTDLPRLATLNPLTSNDKNVKIIRSKLNNFNYKTVKTETITSTTNSRISSSSKPQNCASSTNTKLADIIRGPLNTIKPSYDMTSTRLATIVPINPSANNESNVKLTKTVTSTASTSTLAASTLKQVKLYSENKVNLPVSCNIDLQKTSGNMINLQISNGVLSDPNGPIKLLTNGTSAATSVTEMKNAISKSILKKQKLYLTSPRGRSKSLTFGKETEDNPKKENASDQIVNKMNSRRLSMPSPKSKRESICRKLEDGNRNSDSLLCTENLDTVSLSSSSKTSINSNDTERLSECSHNNENVDSVSLTNGSVSSLNSSANNEEKESMEIQQKVEKNLKVKEKAKSQINQIPIDENTSSSTSSSATSSLTSNDYGDKKTDVIDFSLPITSSVISKFSQKIQKTNANTKDQYTDNDMDSIVQVEDPFDDLKWNDGVGYMDGSNIHFKFNEYGIIDTMDVIEYVKLQKQQDINRNIRPLKERDSKSKNKRKIMDKNEKIYRCSKCMCYGLATEFITPDFCSEICLNEYNSEKNVTSDRKSKTSPAESLIAKIKKSKRKDSNEYPDEMDRVKDINSLNKKAKDNGATENDDKSKIIDFTKSDRMCDIKTKLDPDKISIPASYQYSFTWDHYVLGSAWFPASKRLFANPFPSSFLPNRFMVDQKLEAIDPDNCSVISVATVVAKQGYRIKVNFDGYPQVYGFWVNADSPYLLPVSFCHATGRRLRVPPNLNEKSFRWDRYLLYTKSVAAPKFCFQSTILHGYKNPFMIGMKLEADDLKNSEKVCVATVRDVIGMRILVHFDGWDDMYDYWANITAPYIHPIDWHKENGYTLTLPPGKTNFTWQKYLEETKSTAVPKHLFSNRKPMEFKVGMKLEAVDKRVQSLIRPATIVAIDEYEIKVHFEGWAEQYAYWFKDDSPDIHPIKWCTKTGHIIEHPPGSGPEIHNLCGTTGCRGYGNAVNDENEFHYNADECPYANKNYFRNKKIINRFELSSKELDSFAPKYVRPLSSKRRHSDGNENYDVEGKKRLHSKKYKQNYDSLEKRNSQENRTSSPSHTDSFSPQNLSETRSPNVNELQKRIQTSKNLLVDYGPRLHQVHQIWQRNTKTVTRDVPKKFNTINPLTWDVNMVATYIDSLPNCYKLGHLFKENLIDGVAFLSLSQKDLIDVLNIKLGPTIIICNQIIQLREECAVKFII